MQLVANILDCDSEVIAHSWWCAWSFLTTQMVHTGTAFHVQWKEILPRKHYCRLLLCFALCIYGRVCIRRTRNAHSLQLVQQSLSKHWASLVPQEQHSTTSFIAAFFLFVKIKHTLKGWKFYNMETVKENGWSNPRQLWKEELKKVFPSVEGPLEP